MGHEYWGTLTIENCSVSGEITGVSSGSTKVGGFVGYAKQPITVTNSYIDATMSTTAGYGYVGSFIGVIWRGSGDTASTITIENSYANTSRALIEHSGSADGAGVNTYVMINNVYSKFASPNRYVCYF